MTLDELKDIVLPLLRAAGVAHVNAEYSGSGDSGQFDGSTYCLIGQQDGEWKTLDKLPNTPELAAAYAAARLVGDEAKSLSDLVEDLCYAAVDACGHGGFHNNDGGYGNFEIDVENGTCTLNHSDYVTETQDHVYEDL